MATFHATASFGDHQTFSTLAAGLGDLSNAAGTMGVLLKLTAAGAGCDFVGVTNAAHSAWYHSLAFQDSSNKVADDDGVWVVGQTAQSDTTGWHWFFVTWPDATGATERFHYRNQTTPSAWTHENSVGTNTGKRAGPGSTGTIHCGYAFDADGLGRDIAIVVIWTGVQFADGDFGAWSKTSDLWNHANGNPAFLTELTAATPTDLAGNATFSSGQGGFTGADPDNWTFDGKGSAPSADPATLRIITSPRLV